MHIATCDVLRDKPVKMGNALYRNTICSWTEYASGIHLGAYKLCLDKSFLYELWFGFDNRIMKKRPQFIFPVLCHNSRFCEILRSVVPNLKYSID